MNNEYYNNKYNAQESSVIFWEDILKKLKERDIEIFRIIVSSGVSEEKDANDIVKTTPRTMPRSAVMIFILFFIKTLIISSITSSETQQKSRKVTTFFLFDQIF